jgi:hypothetical protein
LHYDVQVSTNLATWTGNGVNVVTVEIQVTPLGDGMESTSARTLYTVSGYTNHFMRVRVTLDP